MRIGVLPKPAEKGEGGRSVSSGDLGRQEEGRRIRERIIYPDRQGRERVSWAIDGTEGEGKRYRAVAVAFKTLVATSHPSPPYTLQR